MHNPIMNDAQRRRLRKALEASEFKGKMKPASLAAKLNESFLRDLFDGSDPSTSNLDKICKTIGTTLKHVLVGDNDGKVWVVGYVGAGAEVFYVDDYAMGDGMRLVDAPPNTSKDTVAIEVRGDSMAGRAEDGWLLYYDDRQEEPTENMIGKLCIVWLEDGRILAKKLYKGSGTGLWSLLSTTTNELESDIPVKHAALVKWIKPT